ncbi:MAG: amino acid adenylation domain-containing protein, partial [Cyanobacteria bacterium J06642_3]
RDLALVIDSQKNKSQLSTIEVISRDGELPLSFAQQRQWFLHQLDPDNPAYNISTAVQITGHLDLKKLQQCLNILVKGQEVLQTAFLTVSGKPQVIINTDAAIALETVDLTTLPQTEKQLRVRQLQQEDSRTPFALERSPLLRVKLLQMAADEQILLLSVHHIIADGWSMGVLVGEMVELYTTSPPIEEKSQTIQYLDYAAWQRKWLQGDVLEQQLDYWQQQLQNAPVISSFPADNSRKTEPATAEITRFKIDCQTTKKLRQISRQQQATLFMTVLSALHLLLHRYTGNDDLIIGTPIANRDRPEIESLIGLFTNTLALRANLTNNPSFTELLTQVKENTLTAYAHSDLPFEQLVDRLELSRSLSYTPLFQIFLAWETQTNQKLEVEDLTWESLPRDTATVAKFDMTFFLTETREDIHGAIEYNTALYNPETIDRLAKHFQNLLTSIVTQPSQPISEIDFLDSTEKKQLLAEFNQTKIDIPQNVCLHQLFETQVELTPNAPALVDRQQQLTYAELNVRANNLASYLKCCGVKAETKIGVMCDRNSEMTIALLAILKAGGCYIPLDPKYPPQRLDYILKDTQLNILLTQTKHQDQFPDSNLTIINLDDPTPSASPTSSAPSAHPDNLAYIIYTSGSTGKPKGVAIAHKSAVTLCYWAKNTFAPSQLAGVLAATSICFDLAIFEIFVTLAIGGAVILAENALELPSLNPTIPITLINTVPSAARELLRINGIPETVNTVNLAGEALPQDLVDKLYRQPHIKQVYNLYGPSEDTTYSTYSLTTAEDTQPLTIGKAIANTQTYILDKYLKPLPIGISGELYLAGDGLARGYFNRPNLTAAKFIPNPFLVNSHQSALPVTHYSLLYQTGDRVRQLPSGDLEYLGRLDNQIKIRGFRIELGEIETILASHPDIETAVVIKRDRHLIAYIIFNSWTRGAGVARNFTPPTSHKLRQFVAEKLPDYMIPVAFVSLDKFPLTPNGKIDKKSLPKLEFTKESEGEGLFAPTAANTKTEAKLVKIWQKLLNIDKIGINDNFFALGGDSILAIQVIAKASQLGIQLTPKNLFQYQTIAQLAAVAKSDRQTVAEQGIVTGIVPLTPIQHWFFTQELQDYHHWNQSIWLEAKPLQADLLEQAIVKLLQHHDALRLSFSRTETGWQQFDRDLNLNSPLIEYDLSALTEDERETAQLKIAARLQSSFELSTAPLIKIAWFKFGNCADQLLIIAHHLIIDGVSWRIILEDLTTIYQQLTLGQELLLAPKTTSWKQWSEELQNINLKSELAYWSEQKNRSEPVEFTISTVEGAKVIAIALSTTQTQQLLTEVSTAYQTQINDLLLTALAQTWQTIYNQNSLLIELEGHGREDIIDNVDVSRTVAKFKIRGEIV